MTDDEIVKLIEDKLAEHSKMMGEVVQKRMGDLDAAMAQVLMLLHEVRGDVEPATAPVRMQ